jgi:hypothetical protein
LAHATGERMSDRGWRKRSREGEARAQAANVADLDRPLEGPGSERRLRRVHARFRKVLAPQDLTPRRLALLCVLAFLAVLAVGLLLLP